jgi:hypothetical protein
MTLSDLFKIARRPKGSTLVSVSEARSFFERFGIDMETIGFPDMNRREEVCWKGDAYYIRFENLRAELLKSDGKTKTVVTGDYQTQLTTAYRKGGIWQPGTPFRDSFKIQDGELNLRKRN